MKKPLLAMLGFFIVAYFVIVHYFPDTQINKYPDMQTVKENNATLNGWVPNILPPSAYDIVESHDLSANTLFGSFKYKDEDEEKFMENLTLMPDMNNTMEWGNFLFKVDKNINKVQYRNKADLPR
jgi:hypothetical protein